MIRSLLLSGTVLALLPFILIQPSAGVLVYVWMSVMNPHREVYGFASGFGFSFWIAVATFVVWILSREPKRPAFNMTTLLTLAFLGCLAVAQAASLLPDYSWTYFDRFARTVLLALLVLILITRKARIHAMIWIYVISIAYFSIKGGAFTLLKGGAHRVFGPENSMIQDNNHIGVVMVTVVPLIYYLYRHTREQWLRWGLLATMALTLFGILGTYSRTAFLATGVMLAGFWLRSTHKMATLALALVLALPALLFMPDQFYERIGTIGTAQEDSSFMGRVDAWRIAWAIAMERPFTGAGFRVAYLQEIASHFIVPTPDARAAHSIYFELLGSTGFPGLLLFLGLCVCAWRNASWVIKQTSGLPSLAWARDLAAMNQVALASFLVGGLALSLEQWPWIWVQFALMANLRGLISTHLAPVPATRPKASVPAGKTPARSIRTASA